MGFDSGPETKGYILMHSQRKEILSLINLELGFTSGKFRNRLLPPLNAFANEHELIAVIGRNGIGKSTLLRTIAGLHPMLSGKTVVENRDINEYSRIQLSAKVGYISTEIVKASNMRVYDLVALGRFPYTNWFGRTDITDDEKIMDAIDKAGITGLIGRPISELSDGERQRAMIAMVLAQDTILMVMDEPTAFLDISSKFELMHLMHELTRNRNKTIIFSTHDLGTAVREADKIWLLSDNGLLEGAPEDLMIEGAFNNLFDESKVRFNAHDGTFYVHNEEKGKIHVTGKGEIRFWTEKALIRAGYKIAESQSEIIVEAPSEVNKAWRCKTDEFTAEFNSIYALISWIRDKNFTS